MRFFYKAVRKGFLKKLTYRTLIETAEHFDAVSFQQCTRDAKTSLKTAAWPALFSQKDI